MFSCIEQANVQDTSIRMHELAKFCNEVDKLFISKLTTRIANVAQYLQTELTACIFFQCTYLRTTCIHVHQAFYVQQLLISFCKLHQDINQV